jgi:amidohydrolase
MSGGFDMLRRLPAAAAVALFACLVHLRPAAAQSADAEIELLVDKFTAESIGQRQHIHQFPELGNRETKTAELVAGQLRKLGIEVKTGIAHTGVVGILKGQRDRPVIAIRADMDGLPVTEQTDVPFKSSARGVYAERDVGVMHACGHDVHVAALLGTASVLAAMRDKLPGTVMFIFQPAEEGVPAGENGGAKMMVEEGIFEDLKPDAVIAFHANGDPPDEEGEDELLGRIAYRPGPTFAAATRFRATVQGRAAHGASPHLSVDPVVTTAEIVMALQTIRARVLSPREEMVLTVGIIRGGERHNIIPGSVELEGTIRTFNDDVLATIEQRMRDIFDGITKAAHATYSLEFDHSHPMTVNDVALTEQLLPTLERLAGKENVRLVPAQTGAEDFSYFSNLVPGFYFHIGVVPEGKTSGGHHTPTFYADDAAVPIGIRMLSTLAVDYLSANLPK